MISSPIKQHGSRGIRSLDKSLPASDWSLSSFEREHSHSWAGLRRGRSLSRGKAGAERGRNERDDEWKWLRTERRGGCGGAAGGLLTVRLVADYWGPTRDWSCRHQSEAAKGPPFRWHKHASVQEGRPAAHWGLQCRWNAPLLQHGAELLELGRTGKSEAI